MRTTRTRGTRCSPAYLAATAASLAVLAGAVSCSDNSTGTSDQSSALSTTSKSAPTATAAGQWHCPATPDDDLWPVSTHTSTEVLVPPSPTTAIECTYQQPQGQPATLFGTPVTSTSTALTDLIASFNNGTEPNYAMSCPPLTIGAPVYTLKYNFIYPDGQSAIIDGSGYCPGVVTNGTLTKQPRMPPSSAPEPSP